MIRRALGLVGVALLLTGAPPASRAQLPDGPRVAFIRSGASIFRMEVGTIGLRGNAPRTLFTTSGKGLSILNGLSFSADGSMLAFGSASLLGGGGFREGVYAVSSGGGRPRFVVGTKGGSQPVLSPDGETLAFARERLLPSKGKRVRFEGSSVWLVEADGGRPRRVTPWRHGLRLSPSSFSPDGTILALSRGPTGKSRAVMGLRLADRSMYLIAKGLQGAVFSPDGTQLAAIRVGSRPSPRGQRRLFPGTDLVVLRADGTDRRRLTREPSAMKLSPSWDPSGERLLYVRFPSELSLASLSGFRTSVIEINPDGTCRHRLLFEPEASYLTAAWQPGPGGEAGRISC